MKVLHSNINNLEANLEKLSVTLSEILQFENQLQMNS